MCTTGVSAEQMQPLHKRLEFIMQMLDDTEQVLIAVMEYTNRHVKGIEELRKAPEPLAEYSVPVGRVHLAGSFGSPSVANAPVQQVLAPAPKAASVARLPTPSPPLVPKERQLPPNIQQLDMREQLYNPRSQAAMALAQQGGDVIGVLSVLRLDISLGLLANANKGLGHLPHVHHAGCVLG